MGDRIYVADKETLDKTHANTTGILALLEEEGGYQKTVVRYGIKIDKSNSNPNTRVEYIFDAVGMTPASMDFTNGVFNYGSWQNAGPVSAERNYPCMVNYDGSEAYKLDPNDYSKKLDGTASDVADLEFSGNAMAAFVGGWLCQFETETHEYIIWSNEQFDESYNAEHRTDENRVIRPGFYRRIYTPTLYSDTARSISGQLSMMNKNATQERTAIKQNGQAWEHTSWAEYNYIICCLKIICKSEDLKGKFGKGNISGYVDDASQHYGVLQAGTLDDKGQFFGYNTSTQQVKVFHTEAPWGDQWERIIGFVVDHGKVKISMHGPYNFTGAGYHEVYDYVEKNGITATAQGWGRNTKNTEYGRFTTSWNGAENTYLTAYFYVNPTITAGLLVGGACNHGSRCGFYLHANYAASTAAWYVAPGLSLKMPLAA